MTGGQGGENQGDSRVTRRRATLERHLTRYLARREHAATSASQAKRRQTLRRRVIRDTLRRLRALSVNGHERGWREVALTEADDTRMAALLSEIRSIHDNASTKPRSGKPVQVLYDA